MWSPWDSKFVDVNELTVGISYCVRRKDVEFVACKQIDGGSWHQVGISRRNVERMSYKCGLCWRNNLSMTVFASVGMCADIRRMLCCWSVVNSGRYVCSHETLRSRSVFVDDVEND